MQNNVQKTAFVTDAVLMSLHAAKDCGLTEGILFKMLPLINCRDFCAEKFGRLLTRMRQRGLIAQVNGAFKITPDGIGRVKLMERL
jgi:hypothetical protein